MSSPMEDIVAFNASVKARDAEQAAAEQLSNAIGRVYAQIGSHMEEVAALSRKYGKAKLLARLPEDVARNIEITLAGITQAWTVLAEADKLPDLPDEPVATEAPATEVGA